MPNHALLSNLLLETGRAVADHVRASLLTQQAEHLAAVFKNDEADTIYQIDRDVEEIIVPMLAREAEKAGGIFLLAEGINEEAGGTLLGAETPEQAQWRIIMDPIDGTRGIMYDKRSAWFLAGAAPNRGPETRLNEVEVAVMVELPTTRAYLADELWAIKGQGAWRQTRNLLDGTSVPMPVSPSRAADLLNGFGQVARFFAPGRELLARIEDTLIERLYPNAPEGRALTFEDQYISTGGQMHQILIGHDRYIADIREALNHKLAQMGKKRSFVCHPYDICAKLIGEELGVIFTDAQGLPLDLPMNLTYPVDWIAYCSPAIQAHVEPELLRLIEEIFGVAGTSSIK